jgi:hypothetical protein
MNTIGQAPVLQARTLVLAPGIVLGVLPNRALFSVQDVIHSSGPVSVTQPPVARAKPSPDTPMPLAAYGYAWRSYGVEPRELYSVIAS